MDDEERRRRIAHRHRLTVDRRAADAATVADDLVALHSSDPASVHLSACVRLAEPSIEAVEAELYDDRSLVRHHAMRRTLWVMTPEVTGLAHAAATRKIAAAERRRWAELLPGGEPWLDEAIDAALGLLEDADGPLTTREIGARRPDLAVSITVGEGTRYETTVSGHSRALLQAGFEGRAVRTRPVGGWTSSQYAWALPERWVDVDREVGSEEEAATALLVRFLHAFGPATSADVQWWAGWTKTSTRKALEGVGAEPVALDDGREGWVLPGDTQPTEDPGPWVALLPGLDPTAMGWKERDWYLSPELAPRVTDYAGNIGPTVWADGRIVGTWAQRPDGEIATEVAGPLGAEHTALLAREVERLAAVIGDTRVKPRFPSPAHKHLLA